jgi:hypothetical protein
LLGAITINRFEKHGERPDPKATLSIERGIDHHFFSRFGMSSNSLNGILSTLEMTIAPRLK